MRQQQSNGLWIIFFLLTIVILSGAWLYTNWQSSLNVLPPGMRINDVPMGGMTRNQALNVIAQAYTTPISVAYQSEVTTLLPEMVDLSLDMEATAENLDEALVERTQAKSFIFYALNRLLQQEAESQDVNAVVTYSRERVDAFLRRTAQKYDHPPQRPVALPEAGTFRPAREGTTLDIEASRPLLVEAILAAVPSERAVQLVVETEPAPEASISLLRDALNGALGEFTGVAGIFVKDLQSGQELCLNCEVAFAGLSTLKIAIALDLYRTLDAPPDLQMTQLISSTLTESNNASANLLLAEIQAGNPYSGALHATEFLQSVGLRSTFMVAPYDLKDNVAPPDFVTPANARTDLSTDPDPYIQTTPMEMGMLLEGVYQCANGGGFLRLLYPQEITPGECQDVLRWMRQNQVNSLLGEGMPEGTESAHKHGWAGDTHADIAVVYTDNDDFVISVYLYAPEWLTWEESVATFANIGQLTYRFFQGAE